MEKEEGNDIWEDLEKKKAVYILNGDGEGQQF